MNFLEKFDELKIGSKIPIEMISYINRLPKYNILSKTLSYDIECNFFIISDWENGKDGFYYDGKVHIPTYSYYIIKCDEISKIIFDSNDDIKIKIDHNYSYIFKKTRYFKIPNYTRKFYNFYSVKTEFDIFLNKITRSHKLLQLEKFYSNENN